MSCLQGVERSGVDDPVYVTVYLAFRILCATRCFLETLTVFELHYCVNLHVESLQVGHGA